MTCSSCPVPRVATASACVSPRVNNAEPWARGKMPTSAAIGLIERVFAPVDHAYPPRTMPPARTISFSNP